MRRAPRSGQDDVRVTQLKECRFPVAGNLPHLASDRGFVSTEAPDGVTVDADMTWS